MTDIAIPTPVELTAKQADTLDTRIRKTVADIRASAVKLDSLITEAINKDLHKALGYKNIQAYLQDVFRVEGISRDILARQKVVELLTQKQLSQRAIADIVGVDKRTILRDQNKVGHNAPAEGTEGVEDKKVTVGRDGKTYTRKPKAPKPAEEEIIDVDAEIICDNIDVITVIPSARTDRRDIDLEDIEITAQDIATRTQLWIETHSPATQNEIPRLQAIFNLLTDTLVHINNVTPQQEAASA